MVVVLNSGSSSLKVSLFQNGILQKHFFYENILDHKETFKKFLQEIAIDTIEIIIHRVVHGGEKFHEPIKITNEVLKELNSLNHLAPLHNPANIFGIKFFLENYPFIKQYAVFDTAFFYHLPSVAKYYAIDHVIAKEYKIRRYGFHGSSHAYLTQQVQTYLQKAPNMISLHLGSGCSICAIQEAKAIDISMGFTPLEGLMMGSRSGDIDAGVVLYLQRECGMSLEEVEHFLNKQCGLKGICGENDFKTILQKKEENSMFLFAYEMFLYRIIKYIGSYLAILPQCDALVFSGGIAEHSAVVRADILNKLSHFGIKFDEKKNLQNSVEISLAESKIKLFVIPTNEEQYMYESVMKKERHDY